MHLSILLRWFQIIRVLVFDFFWDSNLIFCADSSVIFDLFLCSILFLISFSLYVYIYILIFAFIFLSSSFSFSLSLPPFLPPPSLSSFLLPLFLPPPSLPSPLPRRPHLSSLHPSRRLIEDGVVNAFLALTPGLSRRKSTDEYVQDMLACLASLSDSSVACRTDMLSRGQLVKQLLQMLSLSMSQFFLFVQQTV